MYSLTPCPATVRVLIIGAVVLGAAGPASARPGDLDPSFGKDGREFFSVRNDLDIAATVIQQSDGKIVVGRANSAVDDDFSVLRFTADGLPDSGFDGDGRTSLDVSGFKGTTRVVMQQSDGKIVAAGAVHASVDSAASDFGLARFNEDGSVDVAFGAGGVVIHDLGGWDSITSIVQQDDGRLVVAGSTDGGGSATSDMAFVRFNGDGTLDRGFGENGAVIVNFHQSNGFDEVRRLVRQSDGKLVATGSATPSNPFDYQRMPVVRLLPDGEPDATLGVDGRISIELSDPDGQGAGNVAWASSLAIEAAGRIVVVGNGNSNIWAYDDATPLIARVNHDGSLDTSFGDAGTAWIDLYGAYLDEVSVDANGLIYLAGDYNYDHYVARLTQDGQLDSSFGVGGVAIIDSGDGNTNFNAGSASLIRQSDGRIVTVSTTTDTYWDEPDRMRIVVARLLVGNESGGAGLLGFYRPISARENEIIRVPVRRTGGSSGTVGVDYASTGDSATSGLDFVPVGGTLTWSDGDVADKFIEVQVTADGANEGPESFNIELSGPSGGADLGSRVLRVVIEGNRAPTDDPTVGAGGVDSGGGGAVSLLGLFWLLAGMAAFRQVISARCLCLVAGLLVATAASPLETNAGKHAPEAQSPAVFARFDLRRPRTGPFPSDIFTVRDVRNITGLRLNYPLPDCRLRPSDCEDLAVVNTLDGWGLEQQVSIPFTGDVDPRTLSSESVFLVRLSSRSSGFSPTAAVIGINQVVWNPANHTAYAEVDEQLDQHQQYALIVTNAVRDPFGRRVKATDAFQSLEGVPEWYVDSLEKAITLAADLGIAGRDKIVSASVFSTQSVTPVMERLRDRIKNSVPPPADFRIGSGESRSVFRVSNVAAVVWKQHVAAGPDGFEFANVNLAPLDVVPDSVGTIAYGRYVSPQYLVLPDVYIPPVGTRAGTPRVQSRVELPFTLYLPSSPRPESGWPVALIGPGATQGQNGTTTNFASTLAAHGIATIGINTVGQGAGPRSKLIVELANGRSVTVPNPGRAIDQDGDAFYFEGYEAAPPRDWTIRFSHAHLQTVIDYMQLVRIIEVGMDVDGDSDPDIDPSRIYFIGASTGSMIGTIFLALEPNVRVGALVTAPGMLPEHARWMPLNRPVLGEFLEARTPPLINRKGLKEIDGVPVDGPHFNENKPLRDQPPVVNDVPGAIRIQRAFELSELVSGAGTSPALWSRYLRDRPLPGVEPKSVIYLFAKGDQVSVNPGTSALLRPGDLADRTVYYRHDLALQQDPTIPANPHVFAGLVQFPNPLVSSIARGAQEMIAVLLASDGETVIHPEPAQFFEVPIVGPLPETLNFTP